MFGTFRYVLASMVMLAHLGPMSMIHTGYYAVSGFFLLSGYLMTLSLHERYFLLQNGPGKDAINRLLRVLPSYYVVLLLSILAVEFWPDTALSIHERLRMPNDFTEWMANLLVVPLTGIDGLRSMHNLIPPTWSLAIELVFWMLLPLLVRSKRTALIWGALTVVYIFTLIWLNASLQMRYYSYLAASLPFFCGAALYLWRGKMSAFSWKWLIPLWAMPLTYYLTAPILLSDTIYFSEKWYDGRTLFEGLYLAMSLNFFVVFALSRVTLAPLWLMRLDRFLGNLSYPIFLVHVLAAVLVVKLTDHALPPERSWSLFGGGLVLTNLLAYLLWRFVEHPVQTVRERFKC